MSYIPMFPAFWRLRKHDNRSRVFRAPFEGKVLTVALAIPVVELVLSIVATIVPLNSSPAEMAKLPILAGVVIGLLLGEVSRLISRRGRSVDNPGVGARGSGYFAPKRRPDRVDRTPFIVACCPKELDLAGEVDAVDDVLEGLGGGGKLMLLVIVQRDGDAADNAVAANDSRHGDGEIGQAILAHHERGDGQNGLFIAHDGSADALNGHSDAVVGGALLLNDLVGAVLDLLRDVLLRLVVVVVAAHLAEIVQRNAGDVGAAPGRDLAVAVLADDEGVDAFAVHGQVLAQLILQAGGVQHGAGAPGSRTA